MRLLCIIPSISDCNVFSVNVRGDQTVDELKDKIKEKTTPKLVDYKANSLVLYRVIIDKTLNMEQCIEELKGLSQNKGGLGLDERKELSEYFGESLPEGFEYYIIVHIPKGESIYY